MNMKQLVEALMAKKSELEVTQKSISDLKVTIKSEKSADKLDELKTNAEELATKETTLKSEIEKLESDIEAEQKHLDDISEQIKNKDHKKGGNLMNYLNTVEAANDFIKSIANVTRKGEFNQKWKEHLATKGITGTDVFMPRPILDTIKDFFAEYTGILQYVSTNPNYILEVTSQTVRNFATGRATDDTVKTEQNFNFGSFVINVSEIYAAIKISYRLQKLDASTGGNMYQYVMQELMKSIVRGVERQIVLGTDATLPNLKGIISETNVQLFEVANIPLAATSFGYAEIDALVEGLEKILANGAPVIVTTKAIAGKFRRAKDADNNWYDVNHMQPVVNGVNNIGGNIFIVYDFMDTATNPIVAFARGAYTLIGDTPTSPDFFSGYDIFPDNKGEYEAIGLIGGSLVEFKGAVKFVPLA